MKTRKLTGAVLLWLWMSAGAGATTTTPSSPEQVPSFTVTRMSEPPTIDGVIDAVEWQEALAIGGVADQSTDMSKPLIPRPTTFLLGWDPDHMYFASRTYIKQGYKPYIPVGRSHGLAYVWDDALELNWHPMGANVPAENKANSYKWFLNALGFIGDTSRLAVGQQFKSWNPQFVIEARLTEPGSAPDGGRWWEMEMRATTEDFELDGPHQAGDQWKIMLGINPFPGWMQARVPCRGPYLDPHGYNVMTLAEETPAVQVTMESLSNLATDGTAAITVGAYNPTNEPADLSLSIDIASVIQRDETFHVPPGQRVDYRLDEALPEGLTAGKARVQVREGERSLYDYVVPFEVGAYGFLLGIESLPSGINKATCLADFLNALAFDAGTANYKHPVLVDVYGRVDREKAERFPDGLTLERIHHPGHQKDGSFFTLLNRTADHLASLGRDVDVNIELEHLGDLGSPVGIHPW